MFSSNPEDCDEWVNLSTIDTFDYGTNGSDDNVNNSTRIVDNFIDTVAAKATTPVSLLVESLVQQLCTLLDPDPNRSSNLYNAICQQLHQMNLIDETYAMGEFDVMRSQYQRALYQLVTVAQGQDLPDTLHSVWPLKQPVGMDWSRYHREFDEISLIAGGGFGKVYKARHKLDSHLYAVKKITIKSTTINRILSHLAEVKTLASLNHPNIVPYKAAWLEPFFTEDCSPDASSNGSEDTSGSDKNEMDFSTSNHCSMNGQSDSSDFIQFERSHSYSMDDSDLDPDSEKLTSNRNDNRICPYMRQKSLQLDPNQPHLKLKWATLYIQMALCQLTLREWLDRRNKSEDFETFYADFIREQSQNEDFHPIENRLRKDSSSSVNTNDSNDRLQPTHLRVVTNIFSQLSNGLMYIHSKGIIHHDIKPSNIFIAVENDEKISVQLGDFGLACPLQDQHRNAVVGTPTYAAPEQLNGECNSKSDIYSMGIILLELLINFKTDMERIRTISEMKKGNLPPQIPSIYSSLLNRMLKSARQRPDITELTDILSKINTAEVCYEYRQKVTELNRELERLRGRLTEQEIVSKNVHNSQQMKDHSIRNLLEIKENEIQNHQDVIHRKDELIELLQSKMVEMEMKDLEIQSKDEEIKRLRTLLKRESSLSES